MPVALTYPGVYIEEVPSGVRTLSGVATSITAFVGAAARGPVDAPVRIAGFADYQRRFGGVSRLSPMSYAIAQFFLNGGGDAIVVRVAGSGADAADASPGGAAALPLTAASPGLWGRALRARIDHATRPEVGGEILFNLLLRDTTTGAAERFLNVSPDPAHARFVGAVLAQQSDLARLDGAAPATKPEANTGNEGELTTPGAWTAFTGGSDGAAVGHGDVAATTLDGTPRRGLYALRDVDLFNLLCVPPYAFDANGDAIDVSAATRSAAIRLCTERRAIFIADPPVAWDSVDDADAADLSALGLEASANAALYFPRLRIGDPLRENRLADFAPCGAVAGAIARTDGARGLWKAPAGIEATLAGVTELAVRIGDAENGRLNPRGINCLRAFPNVGRVIWGARTLRGADALASEWKYLPVRRMALYLEESLYRGTQWAVFEPNDEPLWAQIRLNIGAFMQGLFRQGAFAGKTPRDAYLVKCDRETTTQGDIDRGVVNIVVGFAPLKPAEFVVLKLQQLAGQSEG